MSEYLNRRRSLIVVGAVIGIAVGLWVFSHWWHVGRYAESTDDAFVGGEVTVIAPKVAGFIQRVAVLDNQAVHQGDLLVKIDDRDFQAAMLRATAAVAGQEATLANLSATRQLQLALILEARAGLAAAKAEIVRADFDQARYKTLADQAAASVQSFQKADAAYKEALAGADKARAALLGAQRELDVIDTREQQARAALDEAMAEREVAQLNLNYTELKSPIDGVVGNRSARLGAYATVGAELITIVPARGLWVDANFKEGQLQNIRPGAPVSIIADAVPGETLRGHVISLSPATGAEFSLLPAENATGNFTKIVQRVPVRILLDGDSSVLGKLRPGLSVTARVDGRAPDVSRIAGARAAAPAGALAGALAGAPIVAGISAR